MVNSELMGGTSLVHVINKLERLAQYANELCVAYGSHYSAGASDAYTHAAKLVRENHEKRLHMREKPITLQVGDKVALRNFPQVTGSVLRIQNGAPMSYLIEWVDEDGIATIRGWRMTHELVKMS